MMPATGAQRAASFLLVLVLWVLLGGPLSVAEEPAPLLVLPPSADAAQVQPPRNTATLPSLESTAVHTARLPESSAAELDQELRSLDRISYALRRVVARVQPAVVHIEAVKNNPDSQSGNAAMREAGSGVIVTILGRPLVLTNYHVVRDTPRDKIDVQLSDGRVLHPQQVWFDESTDVSVLAIHEAELSPAPVGNSDDLELGDFVLAYGSPFGLSYSVSHGIVSAKGRRNLDLGIGSVKIQDFIQTDAAINPGNSGGPLLNLRGEVVGLNTAIASNSGGNEGIGFSIPMNLAIRVAEQLIQQGAVDRPRLGVRLDREYMGTDQRRRGNHAPAGARVADVYQDSPADAAGIRAGDIIAKLNDIAVEDDGHLMYLVGTMCRDNVCALVVERGGRPVKLMLDLASPPVATARRSSPE